ncbi:MAG: saccharopine dehydrogenase NADP-binding domain-containing protein [Gemmatimonadales bacterium]|nr:saccharopine dehydrogenase NADP-binding domain-containing protein [Gemmatimonadales bacterium]
MKVLVLGAGAVGTVSALKFAQDAMLEKLVIADAVSARASLLAERLNDPRVTAISLNAGDRLAVVNALRQFGITLVLNAALPATNIDVMRACLQAGCDYIDLASAGTDADGIPKMDDQFALDAEFKAAGRLALLGMGADPGTTNVYAAYAAKHLLDVVTELRVRDGDNSICTGHDGFIAAFSPWVMIDECLCKAVSYRGGRYYLEEPLTGLEPFDFPELGVLNCYYVDHEESRTLPRFFPAAQTVDFKLCMDDVTVETLRVMKRLGLSRKDRVQVGDHSIVPRDLVVALLPDPRDLAGRMRGKTCVGTLAKGFKNGEPKAYYIYNVTDHETVFKELGVQATAYQTGIPPVIAARLIAQGVWRGTGVMSPEQFNPDPFLEQLVREGMPWRVRDDSGRVALPRGVPRQSRETVAAA